MDLQLRIEKFESTARKHIKRDGLDNLLADLRKKGFYTDPSSTKYHHCYEGGNVEHSLEVFQHLETDTILITEYSMETKAIVSLFHDICKMGTYKVEMRNRKNDMGKWEQYPYYVKEDKVPLGHGEKSILMILEHMKLTYEEMLAIRWHMGAFADGDGMGEAFKQCPLAMYLYFADMKSTYLSNSEE